MPPPDHDAAILRIRKASDHYAVLSVARNADPGAIKHAYKTQALLVHPDRNEQPGAEEAFKKLLEAYVVLSDKAQRAIYDSSPTAEAADNGASPRKRKSPTARAKTAEEIAKERELDEMVQKAFAEERHAKWVQKAHAEQNFLLSACNIMMLTILFGVFLSLIKFAWPDDGAQASRFTWTAEYNMNIDAEEVGGRPSDPGREKSERVGETIWNGFLWLGTFISRFGLGLVFLVLFVLAIPFAMGAFMIAITKLTGLLFDFFALLGHLVEALVTWSTKRPPPQRTVHGGGGGRRRKR